MDFEKLSARELDALVAEKVMGWTHRDVTLKECQRITGDVGRDHLWFDSSGLWYDAPPRYSTTWQGMGEVIEAMAKWGWLWNLNSNASAMFYRNGYAARGKTATVKDDPKRAVALAALSALTQEVER